MAKLTKPPIPLKMYKHFAVVTLTLTAGIAMFADSDNREAMARQIDEHQKEQRLREVSAQRFGTHQIGRRDLDTPGSFGDEATGDYGDPTASAPVTTRNGARRQRMAQRAAIPGYTAEQVAAMSDTQYEALLATLLPEEREAAGGGSGPTQAQMNAINRASAQRAGAANGGADAPR